MSSVNFVEQQFPEFTDWQLLPKANFEHRHGSVSAVLEIPWSSVPAVGRFFDRFVPIRSLLLQAGAGVETQAGSTSTELAQVVTTSFVDL